MDQDAELERVSDELYGLDPDDFMAARTAAATAAKTAGAKATATAVGKLRRPTRSAWAVNLLSRYAADELSQLLELGDALAAAQQSLSGPELRRLSTQRNRVVDAVTRQAAGLAAERDRPLTEVTRTEVAATLQAALADADVRILVTAGRLPKAQSYSGFGLGLATGSVPLVPPAPDLQAATPPGRAKSESDPDAARAARLAAVEAAQTLIADAERRATEAEDQLATSADAMAAATTLVDAASQEVADLRVELRRAEEAETIARHTATEAGDAHHDAETARQETAQALTVARRALHDLIG